MTGRRNLVVRYGTEPPAFVTHETNVGVGWSRTGLGSDVLHLTPFEPWATTALCGVAASDPTSHAGGRLCRKCADVAEVRSTDDLPFEHPGLSARLVDEPAPGTHVPGVEHVPAEPEITPEIAAGIVQVLGDLERAAIAEIADVPHVVVTVDPEVLASDSGGVRRALPSARGPYPDRASARRAAREIAESLNAAIGGDVPFVCVAVPLATPDGEPWKYALTADTAVTLWAPA